MDAQTIEQIDKCMTELRALFGVAEKIKIEVYLPELGVLAFGKALENYLSNTSCMQIPVGTKSETSFTSLTTPLKDELKIIHFREDNADKIIGKTMPD